MPGGFDLFDPVDMMYRLAAGGGITNSDLSHLQQAAKAWINSSGGVSLERSLRIPATPEKHRQSQRNRWLVEAIKLLPEYHQPRSEKSKQAVVDRLEQEWNEFVARGMWRAHRDDSDPPSNTPPLSRCLFFATSLNRGKTLEAKQIKRQVWTCF